MTTAMKGIDFDIIIPTYDRCTMLKRCLDSIVIARAYVDSIHDVRLLVVDDGSNDSTIELLKSFAKLYPWISFLALPRGGVSRARDIGIRSTQGRYIVLTDSDCVVDSQWLRAIHDAIASYGEPAAIQGRYDIPLRDDWFSCAEAGIDSLRWKGGDADCRNLILRRDVYERIGGFVAEKRADVFAEDLLLPHKLRQACCEPLIFQDLISVRHDYPNSLFGNLRRYHAYGLTAGYIRKNYPEVYFGSLDPPFKMRRIWRRFLSSRIDIREFLYQFAKLMSYTIGVIQEQMGDRPRF